MVLIMIMFVSFVSPSSFSFYRKIKKKKKKSPGFFFCSWSSAAYQTARHLFFTVYYIINYSDI